MRSPDQTHRQSSSCDRWDGGAPLSPNIHVRNSPSLRPLTNRVSRLDTLLDRLLFALLGTSLRRPTVSSQAVNGKFSRVSPDSEKVQFPFSVIGRSKKRKEPCISFGCLENVVHLPLIINASKIINPSAFHFVSPILHQIAVSSCGQSTRGLSD